jgi:hypothetical protein
MERVACLDQNFQFVDLITVKKAIRLILLQKAEVIQNTTEKIHPSMYIPKAIKLFKSLAHLTNRTIPWTKNNVFLRDKWICQYCETPVSNKTATVDHVVPQSRGGKNSWDNTVCSCYTCNNKKGDKTLHEARLKLKKTPVAPSLFSFVQAKFAKLDFNLHEIWE